MKYIDLTGMPRYAEFKRIALDMSADDMAEFSMWCWINHAAPNPSLMAKWLDAKNNSKKA